MKLDQSVAILREAWELSDRIKETWQAGTAPDAAAALEEYPKLLLHRSIVIDLAYEDYLLREKANAAPDIAEFAQKFPDHEASVLDMLQAHRLLTSNPNLLELPEAVWPETGSTFEGLEVRAELGRGTFGRAYLAFDPAIERMRAVKFAPGGSAEAKLIGRLSHPNVTDICWARPADYRTAVCMPFLGACTLADVIAANVKPESTARAILDAAEAGALDSLPEPRPPAIVWESDSHLIGACAIGARIAEAVDYLHGIHVVHGDLKPSNVILEPGGSPRLIDFNLAAGEESPTALRGTPAYMAPELLEATMAGRGIQGIDEAKADLFALGVLLVEFLTGRHPFRTSEGGELASLSEAIRKGPPSLPAALPRSVAGVLRSCMAV
ncbi:MAG TPA: serine/threonine-protein kinase, partial [Urbifossiella sp.]